MSSPLGEGSARGDDRARLLLLPGAAFDRRPHATAGLSWRALATGLVAVTSLFAAISIYQAWSHTEILAKQDVQLANAYSAFFRVTSVFQDPSVYGRHWSSGSSSS